MLWDLQAVKEFWKDRPSLLPGECYTLCIAARNKYLTTEQIEEGGFKSAKMMGYANVTEGQDILPALNKTVSALEYALSPKGLKFPEEACVIYASLNPCSILDGYKLFKDKVDDLIHNMAKGGEYDTYLDRLPKRLAEAIQASHSTRHYTDIDIDIPISEDDLNTHFREYLNKFKVNHFVICTQGGYHIIIDRNTLKKTNKPVIADLLNNTRDYFEVECNSQIEVCKSNLIPLPGSFQAGKLVKIIK